MPLVITGKADETQIPEPGDLHRMFPCGGEPIRKIDDQYNTDCGLGRSLFFERRLYIMNLSWFKNPNNVVYANVDEFVDNFSKETGIENLRQKIEEFDAYPTKEGLVLKGKKRTSIKLFIPDLVFDEHIEMGENVWIYMGRATSATAYTESMIRGSVKTRRNTNFLATKSCEYFPCHRTVDEENYNCIFCYCPLYAMGRDCGGNFLYLDNGVKDCSGCMVPHKRENYDHMMEKLMEFYKTLREKV